MDAEKLKIIEEILYTENQKSVLDKIKSLSDAEVLHIIATRYNWDNGFEIPTEIFRNKNCDLSTALILFYSADGYRFLENKNELNDCKNFVWKEFLNELYDKIRTNAFKKQAISFSSPLSKTQIYKIRKLNSHIPICFFENKAGIDINFPNI